MLNYTQPISRHPSLSPPVLAADGKQDGAVEAHTGREARLLELLLPLSRTWLRVHFRGNSAERRTNLSCRVLFLVNQDRTLSSSLKEYEWMKG